LTIDDKEKLNSLTMKIEKVIKVTKEKHNCHIIWRGVQYEWVYTFKIITNINIYQSLAD